MDAKLLIRRAISSAVLAAALGAAAVSRATMAAAFVAETAPSARRVAARDYYADLRFQPSKERDGEAASGNCLNSRLKITVSPAFGVSWELRESTRFSRWSGTVDPATGLVDVPRAGVRVLDAAAQEIETPEPAWAAGRFAQFRIAFGPCGEGEVTVRN